MKKMFALLLDLAMAMSLAVNAGAIPTNGDTSKEVKVTVTESVDQPIVYDVTVDWEDLTFSYARSVTKTWNSSTQLYDSKSEGTWGNKTSAGVTITNKSNADISVSATFQGGGTEKTAHDVTATLSNHSFSLDSYVGKLAGNPDKGTATVSISGTPDTAEGFTVGTIVLSIN